MHSSIPTYLALLSGESPLFPSMHTVQWDNEAGDSNDEVDTLFLIVGSPSLRTVEFSGYEGGVDHHARLFLQTLPSTLTELTVSGLQLDAGLLPAFGMMRGIVTLWLQPRPPFDSRILDILSGYQSLEKLVLNFDQLEFSEDDHVPPGGFNSLVNLTLLHGINIPYTVRLLDCMGTTIQGLQVVGYSKGDHEPDVIVEHMKSLCALVGRRFVSLERFGVDFHYRGPSDTDISERHAFMDIVRPLLALPLKDLSFTRNMRNIPLSRSDTELVRFLPLSMSDAHLTELAQCLPNLENLRLSPGGRGQRVSFLGLESLARQCPHLRRIELAVDVSNDAAYKPECITPNGHGLKTFDVDCSSTLGEPSVFVAKVLEIFPRIKVLRSPQAEGSGDSLSTLLDAAREI